MCTAAEDGPEDGCIGVEIWAEDQDISWLQAGIGVQEVEKALFENFNLASRSMAGVHLEGIIRETQRMRCGGQYHSLQVGLELMK